MMQQKIITTLSDKLINGLPGWNAQKSMSPVDTHRYLNPPDTARQSAVMILISKVTSIEPQISYIRRTSRYPDDPHSGQISFPGGGQESSDQTLLDTAVRECHEEIGVSEKDYTILGPLTPIYVYVSNYLVQPYIGYTNDVLSYKIQTDEVDDVIEVPLSYISHKSSIKTMDYSIRGNIIHNMPYYDLQPDILWGATAMITAELIELISE